MQLGAHDQVGAFDGASADPAGVAVGDDALAHPGTHVAGLFVLELLGQVLLGLHPFLALVHGHGQALVLVVRGIAGLCCLGDLRLPDQGSDGQRLVALVLAQGVAVGERRHREPVGRLHVAVAAEGSEERRVRAVQVRLVAGAPRESDHASLAVMRHVLCLGEAGANQQGLLRQPAGAREAALALRGVLGILAMFQRQALATIGPRQMHVVLLTLLQGFRVLLQVGRSPGRGLHVDVQLIGGSAGHESAIFVFWPGCLDAFALFFPSVRVAIDLTLDVACVVGAPTEQV